MDGWVDGWVVCSCPVLSCPILSLPRPRRRALHAPGRLPRYILVCECVCVLGRAGGWRPRRRLLSAILPLSGLLPQDASWLGVPREVMCVFLFLGRAGGLLVCQARYRLSKAVVGDGQGKVWSGRGVLCGCPADRRFGKCDGPGIGTAMNDRAWPRLDTLGLVVVEQPPQRSEMQKMPDNTRTRHDWTDSAQPRGICHLLCPDGLARFHGTAPS
jgi:hypothetical protein